MNIIIKFFKNLNKVAIEEVKYARVIERIEELKRLGLWSRKQIEPFRDPPRYKTHWDYLLEEMVCNFSVSQKQICNNTVM